MLEFGARILPQFCIRKTVPSRREPFEKNATINCFDLKVIRFTNNQIDTNFIGVCEYIDNVVKASLREGGEPR